MANDKVVCQSDDCELPHCNRCGRHYYPEESERQGECPVCTIERASAHCEAEIKRFGGNAEEAANYHEW